jgi:hypothetical protein
MRKTTKWGLLVLMLAAVSVAALAEDREDPQAAQTKQPLRTELVKLKYIQPYEAQSVIRAFAVSPMGGITVASGPERIIIIKESPEIVEKMSSSGSSTSSPSRWSSRPARPGATPRATTPFANRSSAT